MRTKAKHGNGNPSELLIFGNPKSRRRKLEVRGRKQKNAASKKPKGHKANCKCPFCKRARGENPSKVKSRKSRVRKDRRVTSHLRKNPSDIHQAVKLFGAFHGRDAQEIIEKQESAAMRLDYTALGDLIALGLGEPKLHGQRLVTGWEKCEHIGFKGDGVKLASAPNGKQLYLIGGNQNLSAQLGNWEGVDPQKDFIDLGDCGFVVYLARKVHGNFQPVEWCHEFGERKSTLPRLMYDNLKKRIFLAGGEYFIDSSKEISPGIEN